MSDKGLHFQPTDADAQALPRIYGEILLLESILEKIASESIEMKLKPERFLKLKDILDQKLFGVAVSTPLTNGPWATVGVFKLDRTKPVIGVRFAMRNADLAMFDADSTFKNYEEESWGKSTGVNYWPLKPLAECDTPEKVETELRDSFKKAKDFLDVVKHQKAGSTNTK